MKNITENLKITRSTNGGAKIYFCPWGDYRSTSYWKTYSHTIAHAYRKGYFTIPIWMIKKALGG
jgi:hypothetical protein